MRKKNLRFWPIAAAVALAACSADVDGPDLPPKDKDSMESLLSDFYASVHPGSRAESPFEIIGVSKKTYRVENDSAIEVTGTRSLDDETFDVKVATLKFDNSLGYTVFSDDERINRVFFFTENGNIADTADIQPLKELIDCTPYIAIETMQTKWDADTRADERVYIDNICRFKWGQGAPYNWYSSVCGCSICSSSYYGGQNPIGCSTVAVAQAIATMGTFRGTYYGNKNLDFSKMLASYSVATTEQKWQVSGYLHEIAHGCQVKYGCAAKGGSSTTLKAAYHYLKDLGFDCEFSEKALDVNRVIVGLKKGLPLLMRGQGEGGHQWIITGVRKQSYGYDFWANWGHMGFSDGWCAGNPYTSLDKNEYYPKDHKYVYFNSKLK